MIEIKILIMTACAALFWWGGFNWLAARRFIMPSLLAVSLALFLHSLLGLLSLAAIGTLCLGYGEKSPLSRTFGNTIGRGLWGLLCAIGLSFGLFLTGHISWFFWVPYLILNFCGEGFLNNLSQWIGDPIFGAAMASIIFIIK